MKINNLNLPLPVLTSLIVAIGLAKALPVDTNPANPKATTLAIPLINHNNGEFWSTGVQVEGVPAGLIDTALDLGGGQFIIPSSSAPPCEQGNCQRGTLDTSQTPNLQNLNIPFSESFGSGTITGTTVKDTVAMGGVDLGILTFELATGGTGTALSAGTLGLGKVNNFTPELKQLGIIDTQTFSLLLSPSGGEMMLGGIDPGKFKGALHYVPGPSSNDGFWRLNVAEFGFSGPSNPSLRSTQFILDSGAPTTSLPSSTIAALASDFSGTVQNGSPVVSCLAIVGATYSITFDNGVVFTLPLNDIVSVQSNGMCEINLVTAGEGSTPTLGVNVLSLFYTVYNVESNTVGFAVAASVPVPAQAVIVSDANNLPALTGAALV